MFNYTANFLYQGDAPLAERRAAALALDHAQLRELLGAADYRELLDADAIDALDAGAAAARPPRDDGPGRRSTICCLHLGDLSEEETRRALPGRTPATSGELAALDRRAARHAADRQGPHRRRAAVRRRRGCGPAPRRARRRAAAGTARGVSRTGRRSAGRSRLALRPHARAVPRGRRRRRGSGWARRRCCRRSSGSLQRNRVRERRVPARRQRAANGATRRCCGGSSRGRSRCCGSRSSRRRPRRSPGSCPCGKASSGRGAGSTGCSTRSSSCRARRCWPPTSTS